MSTYFACPGTDMKKIVFVLLFVFVTFGHGKPFLDSSEKNSAYKDTEEILNDWNNDDSYYDYSDEAIETEGPIISHLPPVLVALDDPTTTSTTTSTTTTRSPVYFPNTNIELGPIIEQVGKVRRNEIAEPVDLPVPYIVWAQDLSGKETKMSYWKKFYNTMYKVD